MEPPMPPPLRVPPVARALTPEPPSNHAKLLPQQEIPVPKTKMKTINWNKIPNHKVFKLGREEGGGIMLSESTVFSFPYCTDNRRWSANETFGPSWRTSIRIRRWRTWIGPRWRVSSVNKHRRWFHRRPARPRAASASTSNDVVENRRRLLLFSLGSII